ncbi:MAG TPA: hypothetical protein PKA58_14900 [Polyangium sp.]|nr:hypothetical protein [Polyangium sp.]
MDVRGDRRRFTRTNLSRILGIPIFSLWLVASPTGAYGQDIVAAETLFNKGVEGIKAGNFKEACPAIAESQKLDPRPGTQYTLAECYARWGKTATAFVTFEDFLRTVKALPSNLRGRYADRVKNAEAKKSELKPNIPELTITVPADAPTGLKITRDELDVNGPMVGLSLPVDPGSHTIVVELSGESSTRQEISISPGERKTIEVLIPGREAPSSVEPDDGKPGKARTIATYAAFGVGAVGVILGGVGGIAALSDKQDVDAQCPKFGCTAQGFEAVEHGRSMARLSTVGFIVGGAGIAAGVVLFLTRPKQPPPVSADVAIHQNGFALTLKGVWQ